MNIPIDSEAVELFRTTWHREPSFACRAPGRVNVIGEHIDYHGFSVLPMATESDVSVSLSEIAVLCEAGLSRRRIEYAALGLEQVIIVGGHCEDAMCKGDGAMVELVNTDSDRYPPVKWPVSFPAANETIEDQRSRTANHSDVPDKIWGDYVACGIIGALEHIRSDPHQNAVTHPRSLRMAISGTVPPASGLSSSSALVCAALIAALQGWSYPLPPPSILASRAAACERYIGTMGGGMDQAASLLSTQGCALLIHFHPLASQPVPLPDEATFVVGVQNFVCTR